MLLNKGLFESSTIEKKNKIIKWDKGQRNILLISDA